MYYLDPMGILYHGSADTGLYCSETERDIRAEVNQDLLTPLDPTGLPCAEYDTEEPYASLALVFVGEDLIYQRLDERWQAERLCDPYGTGESTLWFSPGSVRGFSWSFLQHLHSLYASNYTAPLSTCTRTAEDSSRFSFRCPHS